MLKIQHPNKTLIKQWEHILCHKALIFSVHNSKLLYDFEDQKTITVFYGFLDQDLEGKTNAAHFLAEKIQQQGIAGLNDCYGSFIVIHYNSNNRNFLVANDALGDFAVHFRNEGNIVHGSDFPSPLLDKDKIVINKDRLLHYFALTQPQNNGCFYENIQQLKGGQYLTISGQTNKIEPYYIPQQKLKSKDKSTEKLAEKFKHLLQTVIAFQTQGESRIGVMMSGGMDSTLVAASALATNKQISTFSYVFPNMPEANESIWIDAMRSLDLDMHTFSGERHWPLLSPWHISPNSPVSNPYRPLKSIIYNQAKNKKINIVLTGVFADHLYTGYIYWLVDQVKKRPLSAIKSVFSTIKKHGLKTGLKQIAPKKWSSNTTLNAPWLSKEAQLKLKSKISQQTIRKSPHSQQFNLVTGIATAQSSWMDNEYSFMEGISVRHPFRDRRIVEFFLAIPAWLLGDFNQPKKLAKTTAKDLLPASIIRRQKTTTLKPMFIKGVLEKEIEKVRKLLKNPQCQWPEYVSKERIYSLLDHPKKQYKDVDYLILWQCISFELWQRTL